MDFARKIMQNYGWKDGDGLGKNKDGIAKPLRATLKFDKIGFGADQAASDFNNHWWERVYNEAAENVNVTEEDDQIKMALKDDGNSVEISTNSYSLKKLNENRQTQRKNKSAYKNFLQTATLTNLGNEVENQDKIFTKDIEVSRVNVLTDEELFKACGGRTAHKGARHGLKLSGKLLRIEQQEAELLASIVAKRVGMSEEVKPSINKLEKKEKYSKNISMQSAEVKLTRKQNKPEENTKGLEICVGNDILKKKKRKQLQVETTTFNTCKNTETVKIKEEHFNMENNVVKTNSVEKKKRKIKKKSRKMPN